MNEHPLLGFDIGGTKCAVCRGNADGEVAERLAFPTPDGPEAAISAMVQAARDLELCHGTARALGMVCGGPLDAAGGSILSPPNLPGWDEVQIVREMEEEFGIPVQLENDANAGALAEWRHGAGRGTQTMVFCTMGTGFGCGLIVDGKLFSGANGYAGEIGHIRLAESGPEGFGKAGSVEGFCGGSGIARLTSIRLEEWREAGNHSILEAQSPLNTAQVAAAADAGDKLARRVFEEVGERLGQTLAMVVDLLNPERVVLGSIFVRCESRLRPPMEKTLRREALPEALKACRVVPAELGERIGDVAALCIAEKAFRSRGTG